MCELSSRDLRAKTARVSNVEVAGWMFGEPKGSPVDFQRARPKREGGQRESGGGYPDKDATEARFASRKGEQGGGTRSTGEVDETGKGGQAENNARRSRTMGAKLCRKTQA